ncbi:MAG: M23 family metallopeptidase [Gemmatimonadetes bacterium]|nr:M23 family metallopeptidase [Gemmatimonadota bacterium]
MNGSVRRLAASLACVLWLDALATRVAAQAPIVVSWQPERPVQGTLFIIRVASAPGIIALVAGHAAGEVLHFRATMPGEFEAIAAAPLDAGASVEVPLIAIRGNGAVDTLRPTIGVADGTYAMERLSVAPAFGTPPDSATQARITSERERALAVSRNAHHTPRLWVDVVKPRDTRISSGFGSGREFNGRVQSRHTGTDFAGGVGAPVHAAARGIVALVDEFYLAGNVVYLDHGAGLVTAYFHLSRQEVAAGDTVNAGQPIGRVGATGRVTGPHLHWVVRYGTITVDPLSLLDIAANPAR